MVHVLRAADRAPSKSRTIRFEGATYGTDISFFAVDNEPGQGPGLHVHPYPETWVVHSGRARIVPCGVSTSSASTGVRAQSVTSFSGDCASHAATVPPMAPGPMIAIRFMS